MTFAAFVAVPEEVMLLNAEMAASMCDSQMNRIATAQTQIIIL